MAISPKSIGAKLVLGVGIPGLVVAVVGLGLLWSKAHEVGQRVQPEDAEALATIFKMAFVSLFVLWAVLSGLALLCLHTFVVRPLKRLTRVMQRAEAEDLVVRADGSATDEVGQLGRSFNQMLARLTSMKVNEIDAGRDLELAQAELSLKGQLEESNAQLLHRLRDLSLLYEVSRSLAGTMKLPELLARITSLAAEQLEVPSFSIMLLTQPDRLEIASSHPPGRTLPSTSFAVGEGACGRAARIQRSVYIPDLERDSGLFLHPSTHLEHGSLLAIPMVHRDEVVGVLNLERPGIQAFSPGDVALMTAVAELAAIAVVNAKLHEETVTLSITDALTGAPNRRHLFQRLEIEIARAHRFGTQLSLLMVDIDHFKLLNDAAGHRAGDEVLQQVCAHLQAQIRRVDLLGSYGGEEFLLLLPQVTKPEALEIAEKLRRSVEHRAFPHGELQPEGKVTLSIGIANLPVDASEQELLVDCADAALYASKRAGRNLSSPYAAGMEIHPGRKRGPHAPPSQPGEVAKVGS